MKAIFVLVTFLGISACVSASALLRADSAGPSDLASPAPPVPAASPAPVEPAASPAPVEPAASPAPLEPAASPAPVEPAASPAPPEPAASPAPPTGVDFGTAIFDFYSAFQKIMPCGDAAKGIPVLAPFRVKNIPLNFTSEEFGMVGDISNLVITGMNSFRLLGGAYDAASNRTSYDVIFPEMQIFAEYKVDSWVSFAGFPLKMDGDGLINVKISDYRIVGDFTFAQSESRPNGLRISNWNSHFLIGDIKFNGWNNLWDVATNNFVNRWSSEFYLFWSEELQSQLNEIHAEMLLPAINRQLEETTLTDLIDFFVEQTKSYNSIDCKSN